jgi:hypothetical protein
MTIPPKIRIWTVRARGRAVAVFSGRPSDKQVARLARDHSCADLAISWRPAPRPQASLLALVLVFVPAGLLLAAVAGLVARWVVP